MTAIAIIMRDSKSRVIKAISKRIDDCPVLLAECEAFRQAILMTVKMNMPRVCFQSDSLLVVNTVNGKRRFLRKLLILLKILSFCLWVVRTIE